MMPECQRIRCPFSRSMALFAWLVLAYGGICGASDETQRQALAEALQSESLELQQRAAVELQSRGDLEWVVRQILLEYVASQDPKLRNAAIVGLDHLEIPPDQETPEYWQTLLDRLADSDPSVFQAAADQILREGRRAVPSLLQAWKSNHPQSIRIAELLAEIVGSRGYPEVAAMAESEPISEEARDRRPMATRGRKTSVDEHAVRQVDPEKPTSVLVYYGTNREQVDRPRPSLIQVAPYPFVAVLLAIAVVTWFRTNPSEPAKRSGCWKWLAAPFMLIGILWALFMFQQELQQVWRIGTGLRFGARRDAGEQVHYGTCEVSIPPRHTEGVVERPTFGPENEQKHVVLKRTETLEEQAFFAAVRAKLAGLQSSRKSCFVFIHGFNVDFENAALRTAQMHYDLKFEGVPIFFSWPSRGSVRHYFSDRNEIEFSRYVIKQFLVDIAERVDADRIHVIAHSMGADATCRAIAELGDRGRIFDQIVLAAPDIDREVFRVQIAPRLIKTAVRTTLYCSKNDLALMLSRNFNDSMRAGDSSAGALVVRDVDTIDASGIDTDLLGHSYYGDCLPLLNDVRSLLQASLPPQQRQLQPWPVDDGLMYWTLPDLDEGTDTEPREPE